MAKQSGLTRKQRRQRGKAQQRQRLIMLAGGVVFALVVALIAFGFYKEEIAEPAAPVAAVNGTEIRTDEYQEQVRYQNYALLTYASQLQQSAGEGQQSTVNQLIQNQLQQLPQQVLQQMIDNELIRQEAAERGITVTDEEVQNEIERQFGLQSAVSEDSQQPTLTQSEFERRYQDYLTQLEAQAGFAEADYRELVHTRLLRDKLQEEFASEVPTTAEQVHVQHILVDSKEEADEVLQRLEEGEDFAAVAEEVSQDSETKEQGGELGWIVRGEMPFEFEDVAFDLQPGETSGVVDTRQGFHVIKVVDHAENRELDEATLTQRRDQALNEWLNEARTQAEIQRFDLAGKVPPLQNPFASNTQGQIPGGQGGQP